jgi:hypothetical protein
MMARQLVQKLAGGAAPGGAGIPQGGPSPMGPGAQGAINANPAAQAGDQVSRQLAELQGADPDALLKTLQQIKSMIVAIYVRASFQMPGVARNVAQVQKYLDNAIKEAEQAAATAATVSPIANNASIPNPQGGAGMGLQDFASGGGA